MAKERTNLRSISSTIRAKRGETNNEEEQFDDALLAHPKRVHRLETVLNPDQNIPSWAQEGLRKMTQIRREAEQDRINRIGRASA